MTYPMAMEVYAISGLLSGVQEGNMAGNMLLNTFPWMAAIVYPGLAIIQELFICASNEQEISKISQVRRILLNAFVLEGGIEVIANGKGSSLDLSSLFLRIAIAYLIDILLVITMLGRSMEKPLAKVLAVHLMSTAGFITLALGHSGGWALIAMANLYHIACVSIPFTLSLFKKPLNEVGGSSNVNRPQPHSPPRPTRA
jgi:hypothetical protein